MGKVVIGFLVVMCISLPVFAGVLPLGLVGNVSMKYEDDQLDADQSLGTTIIKFKRPWKVGRMPVTPYVHYKDESYGGFLLANKKLTESAIGINIVPFVNDKIKISFDTFYEYENNASSDDDGLLAWKIGVDF